MDHGVEVEQIATGFVFTEGPLWDHARRFLTFSDFHDRHDGTMYRWSEAEGTVVFRRPSNRANGSTYDLEGRLITCEHGRRVSVVADDGSAERLLEYFDGARLNSPNDIIATPSGDLIFTDPPFGIRGDDGTIRGQEYPACGVFRYSPGSGVLAMVDGSLPGPNGLAMSNDGSLLYVDDSFEQTVNVWDVAVDGSLGPKRVLARTKTKDANGLPDGLKLDSLGNIYVAANSPEGIWVYDPDGALLGFIGVGFEMNRRGTAPGGPANLAWGDDDWQTMYVTAVSSVYRLRMRVPGQPVRTRTPG